MFSFVFVGTTLVLYFCYKDTAFSSNAGML